MTPQRKHILVPTALLSLSASMGAHAQSAWLPLPGEFYVTPAVTYSTFDEFWVGTTKVAPLKGNDESLDQFNAFVSVEYGILDRLAADLTVGYTRVDGTTTFANGDVDGLADTLFGVRYRVFDETEALPVVAVRLGGVIAGSYDENTPFSPGDGAHGVDASLLFGKSFGASGFGAYGELGYRVRENPAPDEFFGSFGGYKQFSGVFSDFDAITVSAGYRHIQSTDGLDIMGAGWNPPAGSSSGFPALKEINQLVEGAIGYTDMGGRHYQFTVAKSIDGRNTGDKMVFGLSVTVPFGNR